ncbi:MAG: hypothetical protein PHR27_10245 [Candidatus Cloacimonetes bacterium]|nr:hypothetical protein [Candidatus Cloacimonadota bacterium]
MAALAYHVLSQEESFSSSYLDGRRHIMILDGDPAFSNEHDLRKDAKLKLDLQAITTLHGFDKVQDSYTDAAYGDLMERLKALLHNKRIFQIYGKSSSKKKKTPEEMAKEEEDIRRNTEEIIEASKIRGMGISEKHINKFIDGVWLEHYLYDELNKISNDIEIYHGIVKQNHFEIDLMAIYGYQMTLISVTTDCKKGGCKLKAFEAIHRAHQLGGDEAKAVLVTLMECPRTLEDDIRGTFGSTIPGFKAFGIDDFDKLTIFDDILKYAKE